MLYDAHGKEIKDNLTVPRNIAGKRVYAEPSDRNDYDISRGLTPVKLDHIMITANGGEPADQCRLALEIEEKNWDIAPALETRRNAVKGVEWEIEPGGDSPADKRAAEKFKEVLDNAGGLNELDSFNSLLADSMSALLPGFSVSEIVWQKGGGIAGFDFIDQQHFTFRHGRSPYLITRDNSDGIALEPYKFIVHKYRRRGGDVTRGGLIRPLAWLHCFQNINVKDLLSFIERYGMPFVVAKVDDQTWEKERGVLQRLIRNFGPSGGGVFTKAVEFELLDAANNGGDVYFKLLEYVGAATTKIILGQTATSGDGGGWSNDGAQSQVRQDILESDCEALADTVNIQLAAPWTMFNMPAGTAFPKFKMLCAPPEDEKANAEVKELESKTVKNLHEAGYETDPKEMSERFGMKLTRAKTPQPKPGKGSLPMSADSADIKKVSEAPDANGWIEQLTENTLQGLFSDSEATAEFYGPLNAAVRDSFKELDPDDPELEKKFIAATDGFFKKYPALYEEIDTNHIEKSLSGAMLAANVNGYSRIKNHTT